MSHQTNQPVATNSSHQKRKGTLSLQPSNNRTTASALILIAHLCGQSSFYLVYIQYKTRPVVSNNFNQEPFFSYLSPLLWTEAEVEFFMCKRHVYRYFLECGVRQLSSCCGKHHSKPSPWRLYSQVRVVKRTACTLQKIWSYHCCFI